MALDLDLSKLFGRREPDLPERELTIDWPDQEDLEILDEYAIEEPHAYVRCAVDEETNKKLYHVGEPDLNEEERKVVDRLVDGLEKTLDVKVDELDVDPEQHLRDAVDELLRGLRMELGPTTKEKIFYYVKRDFLGYGRIDILMKDPNIEDISCDGADVPIFIYHRHHESMETSIQYPHEDVLQSFVIRLAQRAGKHISVADPLIDATLPDGSRAIISLGKEVTTKGSTYTIRKFREEPFTPVDLVDFQTFSAEQMAYLWLAVEHGMSALVVGGTASGKTTTLNAMCLFIPQQMKIVSIEDTREINLPNPNWVPGATRSGFGGEEMGGKEVGEVNMFDLLKAALRQRPEYILVGEIRGEEAYAMFQAMSTGHTAYSTVHADSIQSLVHRLEEKPIEVPRVQIPALDLVTIQIQTRIDGERVRRCKEIVEIIGLDPNSKELLTNRAYRWDVATDTQEYGGKSYVLERIAAQTNMTQKEVWQEVEDREEILTWMREHGVIEYEEVADVIAKYYMDPEKILGLVREDAPVEEAEEVLGSIEVDDEVQEGPGVDPDELFPEKTGAESEDLLADDAEVADEPAPADDEPTTPREPVDDGADDAEAGIREVEGAEPAPDETDGDRAPSDEIDDLLADADVEPDDETLTKIRDVTDEDALPTDVERPDREDDEEETEGVMGFDEVDPED